MACALALILVALAMAPAFAAEAALERGEVALVVGVIDGDTLVLETGEEVRLVGVQAPKLPLGRAHVKLQPLAHEAKATLEALILDRRVVLSFGGRRRDRHGRWLAHLHRDDDGLWLQGEILRRGLARVYSFRDNRALVAEMLALEAEARAAGRGIWSHPFYRIRRAEPPDIPLDSYELVEGRVRAVAVVNRRAYLNFGPDWRRDFTVTVRPADRRLFEREGMVLERLEDRTIRVRGWVESYNGPMIEVTHPEQIEVLE